MGVQSRIQLKQLSMLLNLTEESGNSRSWPQLLYLPCKAPVYLLSTSFPIAIAQSFGQMPQLAAWMHKTGCPQAVP